MPCLRNSYHKEIILKGDPKHAICKTFKKAHHNNDSDFCDRWGINWGLNHTDIKFRNILVAKKSLQCNSDVTKKNQSKRPILRPFHNSSKFCYTSFFYYHNHREGNGMNFFYFYTLS